MTIKEKPKAKLSDFEVGKKVGSGTFGVIVRAIESRSRKEYALKMINK